MALEKLTKAQLLTYRAGSANSEYVDAMRGLRPGEGGKISLSKEKVTRQTAKNRLRAAAAAANVNIKFLRLRGNDDEVVFEVL
jgi:hypothetical protein